MLRYNAASLVKGRRKGTKVLLPPQHGSPGTEIAYRAELRKLLKKLSEAVRDDLLPVVERELAMASARQRLFGDVDGDIFVRLLALATSMSRLTAETVNRILGLEAKRHTIGFLKAAKRALGIDLSAVVRKEDLGDFLRTVATRNSGLIKGLADSVIQRVQVTVTNSVLAGKNMRELRAALKKDFAMSDRRAKLIARDQTAKLTSELNEFRHRQAGITQYVWRTSKDERVRPRHSKIDGVTYTYGKPTGAEEGLPPGRPIQCRCIAQAIVEF